MNPVSRLRRGLAGMLAALLCLTAGACADAPPDGTRPDDTLPDGCTFACETEIERDGVTQPLLACVFADRVELYEGDTAQTLFSTLTFPDSVQDAADILSTVILPDLNEDGAPDACAICYGEDGRLMHYCWLWDAGQNAFVYTPEYDGTALGNPVDGGAGSFGKYYAGQYLCPGGPYAGLTVREDGTYCLQNADGSTLEGTVRHDDAEKRYDMADEGGTHAVEDGDLHCIVWPDALFLRPASEALVHSLAGVWFYAGGSDGMNEPALSYTRAEDAPWLLRIAPDGSWTLSGQDGAPVRGGGLSADLGAENGGCVYLLEDGAECGLFLYASDCTQLEMSLALEPEPDAPGLPEPYSVFQRADG